MATAKKAAKSDTVSPASPPLQRKCGCMSMHYWLLEQHPQYRMAQIDLEHSFMAARRVAKVAPQKAYKIAVVVHVLQSPGTGKVTPAQVKAQIKVLNADFRAKALSAN